ncbi:MAG TPA: hypothetical protein VFZ49_03905 [Pyrinomonadaceae bacterium]
MTRSRFKVRAFLVTLAAGLYISGLSGAFDPPPTGFFYFAAPGEVINLPKTESGTIVVVPQREGSIIPRAEKGCSGRLLFYP